ncbi:hypothetical protein [Naumannella halotolerans]|uniref:Uncharacterized protein n=1 Tax=Naumannella halotolerans TaxID=993414 RepID=A0A4R7IYR9_9ACTN|nr:hypothetical protein [Naumannella halotolerans]TDT29093.1 hypothetical protein CLV29_3187 [Naumannella halotolerans]
MRFRASRLLDPGGTGRPVQPWAAVAGWAALLLPLPAVVWRLAMVAGVPTGFADAEFPGR